MMQIRKSVQDAPFRQPHNSIIRCRDKQIHPTLRRQHLRAGLPELSNGVDG